MCDGGNENVENSLRTLEDVNEFIEHSKLNNEELMPETQVLYFSDNFKDCKLLELNSEIQEAFQQGEKVVFRGEKDKKAVLCTDSLTFELLEAETSNSSLLIPNVNTITKDNLKFRSSNRYLEKKKIENVFYSYYELRKIKSPYINCLESILDGCLYSGPENETQYHDESSSKKLYTSEDLMNICQANQSELNNALSEIGACNINGCWRKLDFNYHLRVFSQLVNLVNSNSWPSDEIPETETMEALEQLFPSFIAQHVFNQYTKPLYERNDEGDALYSFIEDKVCRFLAEALLRDDEAVDYDFQQFLEAWESSVPEGLTTSIDQLSGLAIVFENSNNRQKQIRLCSVKDLPNNINERVQRLFSMKNRWTLGEISPYLKPMLPEKSNLKNVIMKYASETTVDGINWYTLRT